MNTFQKHIYAAHKHWLILFTLLFFLTTLAACKHNAENEETGELNIELTDAEGDFSRYQIDVVSLTLTRDNETIVEVLPENTSIDFAQYVEMSELLTSATVPRGVYTSASMLLNYSSAEIIVENANGDNVEVTQVLDEDGNALDTLLVSITLDETNKLHIVPGIPAHLSLDFDLKTSNSVNFDDPLVPVVTVSPVLNASLQPETDKSHRARGPLNSVNVEDASFKLMIRPFNHKISDRRNLFGKLKINTTDTTVFEINGDSFTGADGIIAMDQLAEYTGIIVLGDISYRPKRFTAIEVYAGDSVPGGNNDAVRGTVLNRADNTLTVKGATLIRSGGSILFNDNVTVQIGSNTVVKRQSSHADFNIDDISIGQRITIFGTLNDDFANPELDATEGLARLLVTTLAGKVANNDDSVFAIDLTKINGRKLTLFDFSGTGIDAANDADPTFYEVHTGTLNVNSFTVDSSLAVKGFVAPFGSAPSDFEARSLISRNAMKSVMAANWKKDTNTALSLISADKITLDFTDAGRFHHLGRGHQRLDLTELTTEFSFIPFTNVNSNENVIYVIKLRGARHVHRSFDNLADDLNDQIAAGNILKKVKAKGVFNKTTGEFSAKSMTFSM